MAQQRLFAPLFSYHRNSSPHQSVELHQTGTFEGRSTKWAIAPRDASIGLMTLVLGRNNNVHSRPKGLQLEYKALLLQ